MGKAKSTFQYNLGNLRNTISSARRAHPDGEPWWNRHVVPYHIAVPIDDLHMKDVLRIKDVSSIKDGSSVKDVSSVSKSMSFVRPPYIPSHIRTAYEVPSVPPLRGKRRVIVTVVSAFACPTLARDVATFGRMFQLPPCQMRVFNFARRVVPTWAMETTLNVQWVYAMNPHAEIRVVLAASSSWRDMFQAIQFANNRNHFQPRVDTDLVTMSFGAPENQALPFFNTFFQNPNIVYMASSGNSNYVAFPSSSPNVIAVGGTNLQLYANGTRAAEQTWRYTGCGLSQFFEQPTYQPPNSANRRTTPDIAGVADPNTGCFVVYNNRGYMIGGTSLASPLYAGILSVVTQRRLNENKNTYTSVANRPNSIQPIWYANPNIWFDIRSGTSGEYTATEGTDVASGLGAMQANQLS